ncbi:MAG: hypothetical protein OSJ68_05885 [Clostridia bacterium]|nr:hypothetical protein [Clostridia bacterium]
MTEFQIKAMYDFDKSYLNLLQREARHTQKLELELFDENEYDEAKSPLLKRFFNKVSVEDRYFDDRINWIEEIDSEDIYFAIKAMSEKDKNILTCLVFDDLTVTQTARYIGVSHQAISKKVKKFKRIFEKRLRKCRSRELPLVGEM